MQRHFWLIWIPSIVIRNLCVCQGGGRSRECGGEKQIHYTIGYRAPESCTSLGNSEKIKLAFWIMKHFAVLKNISRAGIIFLGCSDITWETEKGRRERKVGHYMWTLQTGAGQFTIFCHSQFCFWISQDR